MLRSILSRRPSSMLPMPNTTFSDVRMPGKDGIELLGLIRADERLERVPVILLTAKALTQDRVIGYKVCCTKNHVYSSFPRSSLLLHTAEALQTLIIPTHKFLSLSLSLSLSRSLLHRLVLMYIYQNHLILMNY